ncbi:MAG: DUF1844 domain-containing protein [Bryobacterales bacterium]|nr:DUF1844 domain-containing protein [Bryobacterales bacterium]
MADENTSRILGPDGLPVSSEPTTQEAAAEEDWGSLPIPPADFSFLVYSLTTQAQIQLGLLRLDENEPPRANLPIARHTIDILGMLQEKTRGNLDIQEKLLLENTLTDLRYRYVQATQEPKKD